MSRVHVDAGATLLEGVLKVGETVAGLNPRLLREYKRTLQQSREAFASVQSDFHRTFRPAKKAIVAVTPYPGGGARPIYGYKNAFDALRMDPEGGKLERVTLQVEGQQFFRFATDWERVYSPIANPRAKGFFPIVDRAGTVIAYFAENVSTKQVAFKQVPTEDGGTWALAHLGSGEHAKSLRKMQEWGQAAYRWPDKFPDHLEVRQPRGRHDWKGGLGDLYISAAPDSEQMAVLLSIFTGDLTVVRDRWHEPDVSGRFQLREEQYVYPSFLVVKNEGGILDHQVDAVVDTDGIVLEAHMHVSDAQIEAIEEHELKTKYRYLYYADKALFAIDLLFLSHGALSLFRLAVMKGVARIAAAGGFRALGYQIVTRRVGQAGRYIRTLARRVASRVTRVSKPKAVLPDLRRLNHAAGDYFYKAPTPRRGGQLMGEEAEGWLRVGGGPRSSATKRNQLKVGQNANGEKLYDDVRGGHLIPHEYGGSGGFENLAPMPFHHNNSYVKTLENAISRYGDDLQNGNLYLRVKVSYADGMPSSIKHELYRRTDDGIVKAFEQETNLLSRPLKRGVDGTDSPANLGDVRDAVTGKKVTGKDWFDPNSPLGKSPDGDLH